MGFTRSLITSNGSLPQPIGPGVGLLANFTPKAFAAETDEDISIAELSGGYIHQGTTLTSAVTYTLPTAAAIIAEWPDMNVGDTYAFMVNNSQAAAFDVVIAVNTGIVRNGNNNGLTTKPSNTRMYVLRKTTDTAFELF